MKHEHMRLPNGFGQISKIKSKRLRKPYRAMVTVSKTPEGKPIVKPLKPVAYFKTYNEAYTALLEYNRNPYDFSSMITVEELHRLWLPTYKAKVSQDTSRQIVGAWRRCESIKSMYVKDVRARHCKGCIDAATTYSTKMCIHKMLNQMFDYALANDMTDKNYSRAIKVDPPEPSTDPKHIAFSNEEMSILWQNTDDSTVRMMLIQCYSGWRPSELIGLRSEDIDLENWTMTGGMKTAAGKNRIVPVHEKIKGLVKRAMDDGGEYLFEPHVTYNTYKNKFDCVIEILKLNPEHKPHDPRKTFVTKCKKYGVNEYAIKYMAGHSIRDITEKVYTERDLTFLRTELSKVQE